MVTVAKLASKQSNNERERRRAGAQIINVGCRFNDEGEGDMSLSHR